MSYPCPSCEKDVSSLISWDNLTKQYNSDRLLFCPYCSVGLKLEYDEGYKPDKHETYDIWSFSIATRGD